MPSVFRAIILLLIMSLTVSCLPEYNPNCVDITGADIPIYPNAQNLTKDGPVKDWRETYTWVFTTTDSPEKVWRFYESELVPNWEGVDYSSPQTPAEKKLHLEKGCLFTYFIINSESIDVTTYRITIYLFKEPGM